MHKQRSVARILGAVVGSLGIVLVLICAYSLTQAISRYTDSNRIVSLAIASRDMTNALVVFRLERGDTLSNLSAAAATADNTLNAILEMRAAAIKNYGQALQTVEPLDLPGLSERVQKLRSTWQEVDGLRSRATAALRQEKAARDAALTPTWAKATDAYMDAIGEVTAHLDNSMTLIDPVVDRLLLVKQSAWLT